MAVTGSLSLFRGPYLISVDTAASASKAIANTTTLAESVRRHGNDVAAALKAWEPEQLQFGRRIEKHGKALGNSSQFDQ